MEINLIYERMAGVGESLQTTCIIPDRNGKYKIIEPDSDGKYFLIIRDPFVNIISR